MGVDRYNENEQKVLQSFAERAAASFTLFWQMRMDEEREQFVLMYRGQPVKDFWYREVCDDIVKQLDIVEQYIQDMKEHENGR